MESRHLYEEYPGNDSYMEYYIEYQKRYFTDIRQSDNRILELVAKELDRRGADSAVSLLDIGCSSGGLLFHLRRAFPNLLLAGGDLSKAEIDTARANPDLSGIEFEVMDIRTLGAREQQWDVIVANAILYGFDDELFEKSLASIAAALKPAGVLLAFDFFHPFAQEISIVERTKLFPAGHPLHFRSYASARANLESAGFSSIDFAPFQIPIDLPEMGYDDIRSYTVATKDSRRLLFRGTLFQPWCHLVARR